MKTTLLLAFLAASALPAAALAQSSGTSGTTTGTGGSEVTPPASSTTGGGSSQQMGRGQASAPPMGSNMTCFTPTPLGGPGSFACYPTEEMGGWGTGMGGMMGWHPHMRMMHDGWQGERYGSDRNAPNWYYHDRQNYGGKQYYDRNRSSDDQSQYDNDWRSQGNDNRYDDGQQQ
jgi:hypothetical protein